MGRGLRTRTACSDGRGSDREEIYQTGPIKGGGSRSLRAVPKSDANREFCRGGSPCLCSRRRRHTTCLSDWSSTCALPISGGEPALLVQPRDGLGAAALADLPLLASHLF